MVRVHPVTRLCRSFPDHLHIHRQEVDRAENGYRQSSTRIPCIGRWRGNAWILCCHARTSSHDHIWREGCVTFEEVLVLLASAGSNGRVLPRAFGDVQLSNFLCTSGVNPYRLLEVGPGHTTPVVTTHSLPCTIDILYLCLYQGHTTTHHWSKLAVNKWRTQPPGTARHSPS